MSILKNWLVLFQRGNMQAISPLFLHYFAFADGTTIRFIVMSFTNCLYVYLSYELTEKNADLPFGFTPGPFSPYTLFPRLGHLFGYSL